MEARVQLTAFLINPDGVFENTIKVTYNKPEELRGLFQAVTNMIGQMGGLVREISEEEIEFIPLNRVRSVTVKLSKVQIADATQMPKGLHLVR
jgi:hypothetical protein